MRTLISCASIFSILVAVTAVTACPNPPSRIQSPSQDEMVDPAVGVPIWAIADPGCDAWFRGFDDLDQPIYCLYMFKLVNVTDNVTVVCSNSPIPSPLRHVAFDEIDQWSWALPAIDWEYDKTYRLEFWGGDDPDTQADESYFIECVTFYTISEEEPPAMP